MTLRTSITIRPKNIFQRIQRAEDKTSLRFTQFVNDVERRGLEIYRKNAPVDRGNLRSSITTIKKTTKKGGIDKRANMEIGATVPYASFPDQGVRPSPGQYVPLLGVRVKTGTHPGQVAQNYNDKSAEQLEMEGNQLLNDFIVRISRDINNIGA